MGVSNTVVRLYLKKAGIDPRGTHIERQRRDRCTEFLTKAAKVHSRYTYDESSFVNAMSPMTIHCPDHGPFQQTPQVHLRGAGCQTCYQATKINTVRFVAQSLEIHDRKYAYPADLELTSVLDRVTIECPDHGRFSQLATNHLNGHGCPLCAKSTITGPTREIAAFLASHGFDPVFNDRSAIPPLEIDVWLPEQRFGIEYHGLYWHTARRVGRDSHRRKFDAARAAGIKLVQIFEDEWMDKRELVLGMLANRLGVSSRKVMARKCGIARLARPEGRAFFKANHVQGPDAATEYYALAGGDGAEAVMSFYRPQKTGGDQTVDWMVARFATRAGSAVAGGFSRLLEAFVREQKPSSVGTYADLRWGFGDVYAANGFEFKHLTAPNYFYYSRKSGVRRWHRYAYRKHVLQRLMGADYDGSRTEEELAATLGLERIYDCGNAYYRRDFSA